MNLSLVVQCLRSGEIVGLGVNEETGLHLLDGHLDGEGFTSLDSAKILWEDELGGRHVVDGRNNTDGVGITRPSRDLLSVRDG